MTDIQGGPMLRRSSSGTTKKSAKHEAGHKVDAVTHPRSTRQTQAAEQEDGTERAEGLLLLLVTFSKPQAPQSPHLIPIEKNEQSDSSAFSLQILPPGQEAQGIKTKGFAK